jgi:hypothetical protein
MSTQDLLAQAANLLKETGTIARGGLAFDKRGVACAPHIGRAARRDALGALYRAARVPPEGTDSHRFLPAALAHLDWAAGLLFKSTIVRVNDEMGLEAVLECYRAAWVSSGSPVRSSGPGERDPGSGP